MQRLRAIWAFYFSQVLLFPRQPSIILWTMVFPLLLVSGLAVAFRNRDPEPPAVDVMSQSGSTDPQILVEWLRRDGINAELHEDADCRERYRTGKSALFVRWDGRSITFGIDRTRPESISARYQVEAIVLKNVDPASLPEEPKQSEQSEPGTRYVDFLLPGIMGAFLFNGSLYGIGFMLVDLRARKLLKMYLATPMRRIDILLALALCRLGMVIPQALVLMSVGHLVVGVPINCSLFTLAVVFLVAEISFTGFGFMIGSRTDNPQVAMQMINLLFTPQIALSGVFFSAKRFPDFMQPIVQALPLTQLNDCLREVMLEGKSLPQVAWRLAILAGFGIVTFALGFKWFRWM
jgi:ABC-2 type transport system permease protein